MIVTKIVFVLMIADSLMDWLMNVLMLFRRELGKEVAGRVLSARYLVKKISNGVARFMSRTPLDASSEGMVSTRTILCRCLRSN